MSKNKGPFDAALIYLPDIDECRSAIRLLEAAGRVDKEGGLKFIHACGYPIFPYPKNARQIRTLLEALPDKEEK
jgi:hypothetical protein